jgi:hypothetical protein
MSSLHLTGKKMFFTKQKAIQVSYTTLESAIRGPHLLIACLHWSFDLTLP